jgi:hypothetical protein
MKPKNHRSKSPEAVAQQAVLDLIERDAQPILEQWIYDFIATHEREPTDRELNKAADKVIAKLTSGLTT